MNQANFILQLLGRGGQKKEKGSSSTEQPKSLTQRCREQESVGNLLPHSCQARKIPKGHAEILWLFPQAKAESASDLSDSTRMTNESLTTAQGQQSVIYCSYGKFDDVWKRL